MLKKIIILFVSAAVNFCANAYAGNIYLASSLFLHTNTTPNSNYRGLYPQLAVGYSEMFPDFYLGAEVFGDLFSATLADNHKNSLSARSTWSIGASLLPGVMITESILAFARVGIVSTKFSTPNSARAGGQVGVGLQTCLTPYWDFKAEYIYAAYKSASGIGSVKSDEVGIGFVYKIIG